MMTDLLETFCVGVAIGAGTVGFAWWAFTAAHRRDRQVDQVLRQASLQHWAEKPINSGVEQLAARDPHKVKVAGLNPAPATTLQ